MIPFPKRAALAAALASIGALAVPVAASAAVTSTVDENQHLLTVASDDAADNIVLGVSAGVITVNGAPTAIALAADDNAQIVVTAGAGADTVDASALAAANYGSLTINGGDGDDLITGGADADNLQGGAGNDRLVGFKNVVAGTNDVVLGGAGDDVMVWNNGDGTDVNDGNTGTDEVEVNGSPSPATGDVFTYKADPNAAGRVQFNRTNLVPFGINLTAERLTVNGLGGDDFASPDPNAPGSSLDGLTSLTVNGGPGNDALAGGDGADQINGGGGTDTLTGGDGADLMHGGDDADVLSGDAGDDHLVGDRGADVHFGGPGDDVLVWNNGDGSDQVSGDQGFDRLEVNGSATAGDMFRLDPNGTAAQFQRTNLVPFTIDLVSPGPTADPNGGVESVSVNGAGGDDVFAVSPGLSTLLVHADGDAGNDTLVGAEEVDSFFGGSGNDAINPGAGSDVADGEAGDDQLLTRDDVGDLVRGGAGTDSARTDETTVDAIDGVEHLDATPTPAQSPGRDKAALLPAIGKVTVLRSGGQLLARVPVSCPAAEAGGCRVTVRLETAMAVRHAGARRVVVLGSRTVDLGPSQHSVVSVRLARAAGLAKHGRLAARIRIASSDAAGNSSAGSKALSLRIPRR